ncbi:tumor necrosis factor receptor superfamily member 8 [Nycticebus coucang]|uniref:tumor necrosis factor receptor superfamily member 8 n=1 Tax=Nycticebus coucang TaxID=9470 RepID=UPI00234D6CEA|nr:tumor necrosis factor receptor superfamily member 8 [Nycticebus coucang]
MQVPGVGGWGRLLRALADPGTDSLNRGHRGAPDARDALFVRLPAGQRGSWADQDPPGKDNCAGDPSSYYDNTSRRCCFRCPLGLSPMLPCPQGSADCRKQCEPDYYLDRAGRCTACVSCSRDDLVEKTPCSWNSSRVCECRPGMFCTTSATNSCARCSLHSVCPRGMIVKFPGTAEKDTVCKWPSPGTSPDCSSPEDCKEPSSTILQAKPTPMPPATSNARTTLLRGDTSLAPEDASKQTRVPNSASSGSLAWSFSASFPGPSPTLPCPPGSADCGKQCEPDYYLDGAGRCTACVSCARDDLVEKTPCSWNSSRVCECRPGMFCTTSATNSCARCEALPACTPGMVVQAQGMAERDTISEPPPPGTHPDCNTTPESSELRASSHDTNTMGSLVDSQTIEALPIPTSAPISLSSTGKPILDTGPVLPWVIMVLVVVFGSSFFLLCHWKACRKRIQQKLHLCYPVQTFRPTLDSVDARPRRNPTQPKRDTSLAELGTEELGLPRTPPVEPCLITRTACPESLPLLDTSPARGPSSPRDLPEPRVSTEHTNNRIEKIYIMKADTVIVGTVKAELPEGQALAGPVRPELEEELEVDHAPHYPEQETEPPLGSCRDVMFSVEEEGKEEPLPITTSGK